MESPDRDKRDDEMSESESGSEENFNSEPGRSSGSDLESDLGSEDIGESEDVELESWAREH